ncbi:hypothetical protein CPB86DRAFT_188268 [Serendipita vermifera]|nr:hypothetical protein CPB86DRAFT_188268 [Serendipita vermifera]
MVLYRTLDWPTRVTRMKGTKLDRVHLMSILRHAHPKLTFRALQAFQSLFSPQAHTFSSQGINLSSFLLSKSQVITAIMLRPLIFRNQRTLSRINARVSGLRRRTLAWSSTQTSVVNFAKTHNVVVSARPRSGKLQSQKFMQNAIPKR